MNTRDRIVFYLFVTLICYTLGTVVSATISIAVFFSIGGIAELLFWYHLSQKQQRRD